jgi:hypothetical protein
MPLFTGAAVSRPGAARGNSGGGLALPAMGWPGWFAKVRLFRLLGFGLVIRGVTDLIKGFQGSEDRWKFTALAPPDAPTATVAMPEMWARDP